MLGTGWFFLIVGLILLLIGWFGPSAAPGSTILNWGLLADRIVYAASGAGLLAAGATLIAASSILEGVGKRADHLIAAIPRSSAVTVPSPGQAPVHKEKMARGIDAVGSASAFDDAVETKACTSCNQKIPVEALVCRFCNARQRDDWPKPDWLKADR